LRKSVGGISLFPRKSGKYILKKPVFISIGLTALSYFMAMGASGQDSPTPISKAQFILDQQELFLQTDNNADRVISANDLPVIGLHKSDQKLEEKFNALDTDFSGALSKDEVFAVHEKMGVREREGQQSQREQLIQKFDLDRNGEITSYELEQVETSLENRQNEWRRSLSNEDFRSTISGRDERVKKYLDTNSDGFVSDDEIAKSIEKISNSQRKALKRKKKALKRKKDKLLKQFDVNGDGAISSNEIDRVEAHIEKKMIDWRRDIAVKDFSFKDRNNDEIISLEEYKYSHQRPGRAWETLLEKGTYISRDINDDGEIQYSENEAFIELLFKRLDRDNDGELSPAEQKNSDFRTSQKIRFSKFPIR